MEASLFDKELLIKYNRLVFNHNEVLKLNDTTSSFYGDKGFRIFTFWEPKEKMPAYIRLCIATWKNFLHESEIVLLDYSNLDEWLGKDFYDEVLYKDFSLPKQADAIRCALLKKYGGLWLDADTILTSSKIQDYLMIDSELVTIAKHLAFIKADKNSVILDKWCRKIKHNIHFYKKRKSKEDKLHYLMQSILHPRLCKNLENWDYLGNSILHKLLKTKNKKKFLV